MDLGSIAAKMTLNIANFTSQLDLAESQAVKMSQKTSKAFQVGDALTSVGKTATKALTVPLLAMAGMAIKIGNDFEYQMDRVGAIAGSTSEQLKQMSDQALKLGANTSFSAKEAAMGMEGLASAGFDAVEIMGAMPGVLDLAAVSGGDVALASDAMATSLRAFGLEAESSAHVADVFARAAADSNAEAVDMAEAMKYVAPVAHAMGLSIEETAAAIGIMSDAGIKGSQAGTTLRGALSRLAKPTKAMNDSMDSLGVSFFDAQGKMLPLKDQIGLLKDATAGLTDEEKNRHLVTLYGQESLSGMLALIDAGPEKLDAFTTSLENSDGAAKDMAAQMMGNTKMAIEEMMGAFESVAIIVQQILAPAITAIANGIGRLANKFINASPLAQKMIVIFAGMVAALGPLLIIIGTIITVVAKLKIAFAILGTGAATMSGIIGIVIIAIYALVAIFMLAYTHSEKFRNFIQQFIPVLKEGFAKALELASAGLQKLGDGLAIAGEWLRGKFGSALEAVRGALEKVRPQLEAFGQGFKDLMSSGLEKVIELFGKLKDILGGALGKAMSVVGDLLEKMGGSFGKVGGVLGIVASVLTKVGIAALGISGPWGTLIALVGSFLIMWAKTGELNTDGIDQVFENLNTTISTAADLISTYLPKFIEVGLSIVMKLIEGMVAALPMIVETLVGVITMVTETIVTLIPALLEVGIQILLALIQGIVTALPQVVTAILTVIEFLIQAIVTVLPMIVTAGISLLTALIDGIIIALPQIIGAILLVITTLITLIIQLLPMIISTGIQILMALIAGLIQILPQLIAAGIQIIMALVGAVIQLLPIILAAGIQILMAIISGLISMIPTLLTAAIQIVTALLGAIIQFLPQLLSAGIKLLMALIAGIVQVVPLLISAAISLALQLIATIIKFLPQLLSAGAKLIGALVKGVISVIGALIGAGLQLVGALLSAIVSFIGQMLSAGVRLVTGLISGIGSMIGNVASKAREIGSSAVSAVSGFAGKMGSAAKDMVQGFINGIGEKIGDVASKAKELAETATNNVKKFLHIKSPSRVMMALGRYTGEGFVNGIGNMISDAATVAQKMAQTVSDKMSEVEIRLPEDSMMSSINSAMGRVKDAIGNKIDLPEMSVVASAANTLTPSYPDATSYKPEPEPVTPVDPKGNNQGGSTVNIDTIIVRDDKDLQAVTDGIYNDSKQKLSALGSTTKKD